MEQTTDCPVLTPVQSQFKVFPTKGTSIDKILSDAEFRKEFRGKLKRFNPLVVAFYRIGLMPLIGASRRMMILTTRGKKSGKLRSIPIGYFRIGSKVHLFSAWGKKTSWYRNLVAHPEEVWIQIGMRRRPVHASAVEDVAEIERTLAHFIEESPADARYILGWDPENDRLDQADFSRVINEVLIVRFDEKTK